MLVAVVVEFFMELMLVRVAQEVAELEVRPQMFLVLLELLIEAEAVVLVMVVLEALATLMVVLVAQVS
jgi:hypothetical protein